MNRSEQETREQLIDPKLRLANWDILEEKYIIEKNKACIETLVNDMPISSIILMETVMLIMFFLEMTENH